MAFSLSLYIEVIIVLNSDGSSTTVGSTSFSLVYPLGIRYLLPLLEDFLGNIEAYSINSPELIYIFLVLNKFPANLIARP